MPHAYGYLRVSHLDSTKNRFVGSDVGMSIDAQRMNVERYFAYKRDTGAIAADFGIVGWQGTKEQGHDNDSGLFIDQAVSAYKITWAARPAGRRLNAVLRAGDHIMFAHSDRAFRSTRDHLNTVHQLQQRKVTVHFVNLEIDLSTWQGEMMATLVAMFAQGQSARASERAIDISRSIRQTGRHATRKNMPGLGWMPDPQRPQTFIPDPQRRQEMLEICRLREAGHSYYVISDMLECIEAAKQNRRRLYTFENNYGARYWTPKRCEVAIRRAIELGLVKSVDESKIKRRQVKPRKNAM